MRRQDHDRILSQLTEQIVKAVPFRRIETRRRLIHDDQFRVADQRLRNAETVVSFRRNRFPDVSAGPLKIDLFQKPLHHILPFPRMFNPLQPRDMIQHPLRRDLRIDPELLRQIAEQLPDPRLVPQHIQVVQRIPYPYRPPAAWRWSASARTYPHRWGQAARTSRSSASTSHLSTHGPRPHRSSKASQ